MLQFILQVGNRNDLVSLKIYTKLLWDSKDHHAWWITCPASCLHGLYTLRLLKVLTTVKQTFTFNKLTPDASQPFIDFRSSKSLFSFYTAEA